MQDQLRAKQAQSNKVNKGKFLAKGKEYRDHWEDILSAATNSTAVLVRRNLVNTHQATPSNC